MTVYVVSHGTQFEGGGVDAIFAQQEDAVKRAKEIADNHSSTMVKHIRKNERGWNEQDIEAEAETWTVKPIDHPLGDDSFIVGYEWGCYYANVIAMTVRP